MTQVAATADYNRSIDVASMPDRIRRLPVSPTGYPVPWFVAWMKDGEPSTPNKGIPDFRIVDPRKLAKAVNHHCCWICGDVMGVHKAFTIGPMCAINRVISEPPAHTLCATWSVRMCPFLARPNMVRNTRGMLADDGKLRDGLNPAAGFHLDRNPGAVCIWITKQYRIFHPHAGDPGVLFSLGNPIEVQWYAKGRRATRKEVLDSIESGYPSLIELARQEGPEALAALATKKTIAMALMPS